MKKKYKSTYIAIRVGGKKMDLHRYLWIKKYGLIPKGMIIHHKNENKHDNRLENLEMISYSEHSKRHNTLSRFYAHGKSSLLKNIRKAAKLRSNDDYENNLFWCNSCKSLLDKNKFGKNSLRVSGLAGQCKKCRSRLRSKKTTIGV